MLITICDKDGDWEDNAADCADPKSQNCKISQFNKDISSMIGFSIFPPNSAGEANDVWDHVEWDKAPRDTIDQGSTIQQIKNFLKWNCCKGVTVDVISDSASVSNFYGFSILTCLPNLIYSYCYLPRRLSFMKFISFLMCGSYIVQVYIKLEFN